MNLHQLVRKKKLTQSEYAALINVNQSTISKHISAGVLSDNADWITWNRELIHHLIEVAAGRRGEAGDLDIVQESARLKKLQGDRIQAELKQTMREVIHFEPLALAFSSTLVMLKTKILALPYKLTSRASSVTSKDIAVINDVIREVLTDMAESAPWPPAVGARIQELENSHWSAVGVDRKAILNGSTVKSEFNSHLDKNSEVENAGKENGRRTKAEALEETRA